MKTSLSRLLILSQRIRSYHANILARTLLLLLAVLYWYSTSALEENLKPAAPGFHVAEPISNALSAPPCCSADLPKHFLTSVTPTWNKHDFPPISEHPQARDLSILLSTHHGLRPSSISSYLSTQTQDIKTCKQHSPTQQDSRSPPPPRRKARAPQHQRFPSIPIRNHISQALPPSPSPVRPSYLTVPHSPLIHATPKKRNTCKRRYTHRFAPLITPTSRAATVQEVSESPLAAKTKQPDSKPSYLSTYTQYSTQVAVLPVLYSKTRLKCSTFIRKHRLENRQFNNSRYSTVQSAFIIEEGSINQSIDRSIFRTFPNLLLELELDG